MDEARASAKLKAHATRTIEGVFQNLNTESLRLHRAVNETTPGPKTLSLAWRLFSLQHILHSDFFRDYPRPCFNLVETGLRILSLSDADELSKVMAHLNLFHLLSGSPLAEQHFKQALTYDVLPELETVYAMKLSVAK